MSDLRLKLIRLAHANPELRSELLPLLKEAVSPGELDEQTRRDRAMFDQLRKQRDLALQPTGWMNYQTTLKNYRGVKDVMKYIPVGNPGFLMILKRETNETEFDRLKKKWWGNGHTVKERGMTGKVIQRGGKFMLIVQKSGKWVIIRDGNFKI